MSDKDFPNKPGLPNIYFHISENSGVGYYRLYLPALKLREHGLANVMISDFRWGVGDHVEPDLKFLTEIVNWADLIVVGRKDMGEFYAQWGTLKEFFKIPIILDTDDNVMHVRPSNPGYAGYHPGSQAIEWNKLGVGKVFDAITVSTKNLVSVYKKYNPKIFHLPNNLDVAWWDSVPQKKKNDGFIRIGFIASASHPEGVRIIKQPIIDILRKHKNVKFLITSLFKGAFEGLDVSDRIEAVPWIPLKDWPEKYKELDIDIGLAPLADNLFNRAKSNLRWMEYSVQGIPSVLSPVEAYSCVIDGADGLLARESEDWFNAIDKLVTDGALRQKIGAAARQRISTEYNIDTNIGLWFNVYEDIRKKYLDFFGPKRNYVINKKGLQELGWRRKR